MNSVRLNVVIALLLLLVGMNACVRNSDQTEEVLVRIVVPGVGSIDSLRITKYVDDVEVLAILDDKLDGGLAPERPTAAVTIPQGRRVTIRVQALLASIVVAAGEAPLDTDVTEYLLYLVSCAEPEGLKTVACSRQLPELNPDGAPGDGLIADAATKRAPDTSDADVMGADAVAAGVSRATCPAIRPPLAPPALTEGPTPHCIRYCAAMDATCRGLSYEGTREDCLRSCVAFDWPTAESADARGDTITCRTKHAELAATHTDIGEKRRHCDYALPDSRGACGPPCFAYCRLGTKLCRDQFPSLEQCWSSCTNLDLEAQTSTGEGIYDLLHCRMRWLVQAAVNPTPALCQRGAPSDVCPDCPPLTFPIGP